MFRIWDLGFGVFGPARLRRRWSEPAGYRDVLAIAGPLILSTSSWTLQHFINRVFLCWHSTTAMAAATPAATLSFTAVSLFLYTANYANTFVAQYHGAGRPERVGPAVWQAVYFSALAGAAILCLIPLVEPIFRWAGHDRAIQELECAYMRILCLGAGLVVYNGALSSFFSGRGKTWTVLWVNLAATALNIALDYAWIFGHFGFPALGIRGAAWATNTSLLIPASAYSILFFSADHQRRYATARGWRFDPGLFRRLLRYGLPNGLQVMLDMMAFTFFVLLIGRIGPLQLGASSISFQINQLSFLPMIGFAIATSTLVGQSLGRNQPGRAERATWSAFHMTFGYASVVAVLFVAIPSVFINVFGARSSPAEFAALRPMAVMLLRFVAFYSLFDTMCIVFSASLKGAGDTRFVMFATLVLAWTLMVAPTWLAYRSGARAIYAAWAALTAYVVVLGLVFLWRFRRGAWRSMRVIESPSPPPAPAVALPEAPTTEVDL